jgi:hypothetical protein
MMPVKGRTTTKSGSRWYDWQGERYWSVTTILSGGLPKPALVYWAANQVASYTCDNLDTIYKLVQNDPEAAYDMLKRTPWRSRDKAAKLGSSVHEAAEAHALGKPYPAWSNKIAPRMKQFARFIEEHEPDIEMVEAPVYNSTERYAGTLDMVAKFDGKRVLLDTKTGEKGPYPDVGLQLAAYRFAEFRGLPDGSASPMPKVDTCAVLKLTDDEYKLFEVKADEEVFMAFKYVREVFRWAERTSKHVISDWPVREETT